MTHQDLPLPRDMMGDTSSPRLLVSVRDSEEAKAAMAGGADWIDLKEPHAGSLGAVTIHQALDVVAAVDGNRAISAALGELVDWSASSARELLTVAQLQVMKLGFHGCAQLADWPARFRDAVETIHHHGKAWAAVAYADWETAAAPPPDRVIKLAGDLGCQHLLIDTYEKNDASLVRRVSRCELQRVLNDARRLGMQTLVGGGIVLEDIARLPLEQIDVLAVRGGVCRGGRIAQVDRALVAAFWSILNA